MQTYRPSPWTNLHTCFKLGFFGSNGVILTLIFGILLFIFFYTSSFNFFISQSLSYLGYGLIFFLLSNQFICIYCENSGLKKTTPVFSQLIFNENFNLIFPLVACCIALIYPFYHYENTAFISKTYSLFFLLFSPAIIGSLLSEKSLLSSINPITLLSFIVNNISQYLFGFVIILLMGLGYKTICYYATIWLPLNWTPILNIELAAYLFLVSGYVLSDLFNKNNLLPTADPDAQDLNYLKKYISTGHYDQIHDFFKPGILHTRSINLLDFYLKFIIMLQDEKIIYTFGNRLINLLYMQNNIKKAVSVFELIFKKYPYFNLSEPLINFTLAKHFFLSKQYQIVVHLLKNIPEKSSDFRYLPEVFLMLAKAYLALNLEVKAKQAIEEIIQKFSTSQYYSEAIDIKKILQTNISDRPPPSR